ncbi:MAG: DNA recombination protein RmuC [Bdellovibrionota bacterium]
MHDLLWLGMGAVFAGVAFFFSRRRDGGSFEMLQAQVSQLSQQLNERMKETSSTLSSTQAAVGQRLDNAAALVSSVERKLGALEESSKRIYALGEGLQELRDVLKSPKLRGNMGEFFLEDLLRQILPPEHYSMQYPFKSGETVDAVILLGDAQVCVDSKFPLESFTRLMQLPEADVEARKREKKAFVAAIKRHADSIAKKYILPDEGTYDFALMYIPAENVYYETIIRDETLGEDGALYSYLLGKRVIPVSPNSLYAYLQVIVLGLRGLKVESHARQLAQDIQRLSGELGRFHSEYGVLGKHLKNAAGSYDEGSRRLEKFEARLEGISGAGEKTALAEPPGVSPS